MIDHIKNRYFADKNYGLVYLHNFFHSIGKSAMQIFTGAYFLSLGMPLHFVLLFYGLEYGVRGLLCPFGLAFFNKVGVIKALYTSVFFFILFFIGVSLADQNLWIGFFSLFFAAISGSIYYPFKDVMEALYIQDDHNRAKQMTMGLVLRSLGAIFGSAGVGFVLTAYGFDVVVIFISISLIISILPFFYLKNTKPLRIPDLKPSTVYTFLLREDFRTLWKPMFGEQLLIILNNVMIPIFIFTLVGEMDSLGYIIAFTLIAEKICTLTAGHYTDKLGVHKAMRFSMMMYPLAMGAYIFLAKTPLSAFFVESYNKIINNIHSSAFNTGFHIHARKHYKDEIILFGAGWQMALCFGELLVLPLYGLLAYFIGINVFYIACGITIWGIWLTTSHFNKKI